jgi:hypothetical protein
MTYVITIISTPNSITNVGLARSGLLNHLRSEDNFGKTLTPCKQHEIQYIK